MAKIAQIWKSPKSPKWAKMATNWVFEPSNGLLAQFWLKNRGFGTISTQKRVFCPILRITRAKSQFLAYFGHGQYMPGAKNGRKMKIFESRSFALIRDLGLLIGSFEAFRGQIGGFRGRKILAPFCMQVLTRGQNREFRVAVTRHWKDESSWKLWRSLKPSVVVRA